MRKFRATRMARVSISGCCDIHIQLKLYCHDHKMYKISWPFSR